MVRRANLRIVDQCSAVDLGEGSEDWQRRTDRVEAELKVRYGDDPRWQLAQRQSDQMGELIGSCAVVGKLLHLRHPDI